MARFVVALADEIPPGGRKTVQAAGRSIGIFNIDGEYFAPSQPMSPSGRSLMQRIPVGQRPIQ